MATRPTTITGPDGQLRQWQPSNEYENQFNYLGPSSGYQTLEDARRADEESDQGSYVPASYRTHMPWWMKAFIGTGLASAGVTGLGAAFAPGAFGGAAGTAAAGAGTGAAGAAAPSLGVPIGGVGSLGALNSAAGISTIPLGGAAAGGGAAGAGLTSGAMGGTTFGPTAAGTGVFGGSVPAASFGGAGVGGAAAPSLGVPIGGAGSLGALNAGAGVSTIPFGAAPAAAAGGGGAAGGAAAGRAAAGRIGTLAKLGTLGQVLTNYAGGAAQGRQAEANLNLNADALRQRQVEADRQYALDRATKARQFEEDARRLATWARTVASFDNGTDPRHLKDIIDQAYQAAMQRLLSGNQLPPNIPTPPMTPPPNESLMDRIARLSGILTGTIGAFSNYRPPASTGGR